MHCLFHVKSQLWAKLSWAAYWVGYSALSVSTVRCDVELMQMWTSFWFSWTTFYLSQAHTLFTTYRPIQDPRVGTSHKSCHWCCCAWEGWEVRGSKELCLCFISQLARNEEPKQSHTNPGILLVAVPQQSMHFSWLPSQSLGRMKILKVTSRNSWIGVKYCLGKR